MCARGRLPYFHVCGRTMFAPTNNQKVDIWPRRGQYGEGPKSVKKNAVIPAFFSFWVLRPQLWGSKGRAAPEAGLRGCKQGATVERSETGERAMFAPAGRITARAGLRSKLAALVVRRQALAPKNPKDVVEESKSKKMQECCIFLNAFGSFSILTPSGPKFLYGL